MSMEELNKAAPCDDCGHYKNCKTQDIACKQFMHYVNSGRVVYGDKMPTREISKKIFVEDVDDTSKDTPELKEFFKELT